MIAINVFTPKYLRYRRSTSLSQALCESECVQRVCCVVCALWTVHCRAVSAVSHSLSLTDPASVAVGHERSGLERGHHTRHRAQHSAHTNCIQILCMHRATLVTFATTTHREAPSFHWRHASILQIRESHAQVMTQVHVTNAGVSGCSTGPLGATRLPTVRRHDGRSASVARLALKPGGRGSQH